MRHFLEIRTILPLTIALSCGATSGTTKDAGSAAPPQSACSTAPLRASAASADHGSGAVH